MKRIVALLAFSACAIFAQSPVVTEILNNYGLSNSPTVAQGAIFIVKGSNLSDSSTGLQDVPLQTQLQGVRIAITVGEVTTLAPMYYVLPQQLAGILPSNTPVGNGTLVVRNNSKNSIPVPINVVRSAFGVLTVSGAGAGAARVQDASQNYQELLSTRSTNPGNFLVFYGSGVGPVTGDETVTQVQTNLTSIPTTVTIGGKAAEVFYRGRTVYPGLDQINVRVPALDSYSCSVAVVITTNGVQANATTIPVAQSGPNCPTGSVPSGPLSGATQQEIDRWAAAGTLTKGTIQLGRTTLYSVADSLPGVTAGTTITKTDSFGAAFERVTGSDLGKYLRGEGSIPAVGACLVNGVAPTLTYAALDAGASITATGPPGTQVAERNGSVYTARLTGPLLNSAGRFTVTGSGGPGAGAFSGSLDVVGEFVVTNPDDFKSILRDAGVTVRWTGGDPTIPVQITGSSVGVNPDGTAQPAVTFTCLVNAADGRFTVPASILNQLPATGGFSGAGLNVPLRGSFSVVSAGKGVRITASGIDHLFANNAWTWTVTSEYR